MPSSSFERPEKPYPGLRPFETNEWSIFFGRERMIDDVIERLARNRLVLIHGASGSGKSSLVRAGVMPKLARQHRRHGTPWLTCAMRPAGGPLWNLATELARLEQQEDNVEYIEEIFRAFNWRDVSLSRVVGSIEALSGKSVCILVDQFEELFRFEQETSREEAELFVDLIVRTVREEEDPGADVHVVVTMRSEFLGQCARFAGLAETINDTQYLVPRMDDEALLRAIRRPAQLFKGKIDDDLAYRLMSRVRGREDELPLLQHALMLMWENAEASSASGGSIVLDGTIVEEAGGLAELLSAHADKVMRSIAPDKRSERTVEMLFRELTDVNAEGNAIRRPQRLSDLAAVAATTVAELRPILDAFRAPGVSFLTPYAPSAITDASIIDISHEALIRCWGRLGAGPDSWLRKEVDDGLAWRSLLVEAEAYKRDPRQVLSPAATEDRGALVAARNEAWSRRHGGGWLSVARLLEVSRVSAARAVRKARIAMASLSAFALGTSILAYVSFYEFNQVKDEQKRTEQQRRVLKLSYDNLFTIGNRPKGKEALVDLFQATREMANDDGNKDATYQLALLYYNGLGTHPDSSEAFKRLKIIADEGYAQAYSAVGYLYESGQGVARNYSSARDWLQKAAETGDSSAMNDLGGLYQNGLGGSRDYDQALRWFKKAAALGDRSAMTSLGKLYIGGSGVPQNGKIALSWFDKAAAEGDSAAMNEAGVVYENGGNGIQKDGTKAFDLFTRAATDDNGAAMNNLGLLYLSGNGIIRSVQKAREWFEKGAAAHNSDAMLSLGNLYAGTPDIPQDFRLATKWYSQAASMGNAVGMYKLGTLHAAGQGSAKDYDQAREWFEKSAAAGNTDAMNALGDLYANAEGVEQDYRRASVWYAKASAGGNALAMVSLGELYATGRGVAQDNEKARQIFEKAGIGDGDAMLRLGQLYAKGQGVALDYSKARAWFERAAVAKNGAAMDALGVLYANGQGVPQDYSKAFYWYGQGQAAGNAEAMNHLGLLYVTGQGIAQNFVKAHRLFDEADAAGDSDARENIGELYANGQGVTQSYVKAYNFYNDAAGAGNTDAMNRIGKLFALGQGFRQDYYKALQWYRLAALAGSSEGMLNLGALYADGLGVAQDYGTARDWYTKAADAQNDEALERLGTLYAKGLGVPQNFTKARECYAKAADAGDTRGLVNIGTLYANGLGIDRDYRKALIWYKKAADNDNSDAFVKIGGLYAEGQGVKRNYSEARKWYEKALASGVSDAAIDVGWTSLVLHDFPRALRVSEDAVNASPKTLAFEKNRAHALMFLGRTEEAKTIYLSHSGEKIGDGDNRTWQEVILQDFDALRKVGLDNSLMKEIEADFAAHKT